MERLGLWGEGLAFHNFDSFLESITRRGLGAAEMLAMEMKSAGVYVSRGLSYKQAEVYLHCTRIYLCIHTYMYMCLGRQIMHHVHICMRI